MDAVQQSPGGDFGDATYQDLVSSPDYQSLSPKEQSKVQTAFFNEKPFEVVNTLQPSWKMMETLRASGPYKQASPEQQQSLESEMQQDISQKKPDTQNTQGLKPAISPFDFIGMNPIGGATENLIGQGVSKLPSLLGGLIKGGAIGGATSIPQTVSDLASGNEDLKGSALNTLANAGIGGALGLGGSLVGNLLRTILPEATKPVDEIATQLQEKEPENLAQPQQILQPQAQGPFSPRGLNPEQKLLPMPKDSVLPDNGGMLMKPPNGELTAPPQTMKQLYEGLNKPGPTELQNAVGYMKSAADEIKGIVAPSAMTGDALKGQEIFRENLGNLNHANDLRNIAFNKFETEGAKLPVDKQLELTHFQQTGKLNTEEARNMFGQPMIDAYKQANAMMTERFVKAQEVAKSMGEEVPKMKDNYAPQSWVVPPKGSAAFKRIEGNPAYKNPQILPNQKVGMSQGFNPRYPNPFTAMKMKTAEYDRDIVMGTTKKSLLDEGIIKDGKIDKDSIPKDWIQIPSTTRQLYAPPELARIFQNHLSTGLADSPLYKGWMKASNALNQFQLGISAYHVGFTTMEAVNSKVALALKYFASGHPWLGLKSFAQAIPNIIMNPIMGDKLLKAYYGQSKDPAFLEMANLMDTANLHARMDKEYSNAIGTRVADLFHQGKIVQGAWQGVLNGIETLAKPIMNELVPRQKLGAFFDMMRYEKTANMTTDELRHAAQTVANSIDNRFGQLTYDNLFWNKTFKHVLMGMTRSVGWNLGTLRELGGGFKDIFTSKTLTHRTAYLLTMPLVVGVWGAIYQFIRTGKGPENLKDLYYPRTGKLNGEGDEERVTPASYMKDLVGYAKNIPQTIANKASPMLAMLSQMLANKDFYGSTIRHGDDPVVKQFADVASYMLKQAVPFGIRNIIQQGTLKDAVQNIKNDPATAVQNFVGITPARRDMIRSPLENKIAEIEQRKLSATKQDTTEKYQQSQTKRQLSREMYNKDPAFQNDLSSALQQGKLSKMDVQNMMKNNKPGSIMQLRNKLNGFNMDDMLELMKVASPEEKKTLMPLTIQKGAMEMKSPYKDMEEKTRILNIIRSFRGNQ